MDCLLTRVTWYGKIDNMSTSTKDGLITMTEAAAVLGVTRQRVHALIKAGLLDTVKYYGKPLVWRVQVEARATAKKRL
jgi:hypothetical protein